MWGPAASLAKHSRFVILPVLFWACAAPAPRPPSAAVLSDARTEPSLPTGKDVQEKPYPPLHYARFAAENPAGPLRDEEIFQGKLGSCFFLSALAAVARTRPELVAGALRATGPGEYEVTLYDRAGRPRRVAVDDLFPALADGSPALARGKSAGDLRPALFEKAYAKLSGGYHAIDGGDAWAALAALTGAPAKEHDPRKMAPDAVWALLADAGRRGLPVEASTPEFDELKRLTGREDLAGLIDDHDYDVLGVSEEGGRRAVRLYTPLTPRDAADAPLDARRIDVPFDEFLKDFDGITVGSFREAR